MTDFSVEYIGDEPGDVEKRLSALGPAGRKRTNNALRQTAEEVKEELIKSSPVDSGEYQRSWYIQPYDYNEVWIMNEADHAKYVMLPNAVMVNASGADLPASGILHNVKGRAKAQQKGLKNNFMKELQDMIQGFSVG